MSAQTKLKLESERDSYKESWLNALVLLSQEQQRYEEARKVM